MIVILGESASGKSTLQQMLVEAHPDKYKKLVTYTTRPMREGERDGVDYHFISEDKFLELARSNFFIEHIEYRGWHYGTANEPDTNKEIVAVLNPPGLRAFKRAGLDVISVYICVDRKSRLIKILERGDDIEEAYRRNITDVGQFNGVKGEVDFVIYNENFELSKEQVLKKLEDILNKK